MATCIPQVDGLSTDPLVLGLHVRPRENSNFLNKGKMVILVLDLG